MLRLLSVTLLFVLAVRTAALPQDRVETVQLAKPGRYLAVCGFVPHFDDRMFGYIRVLR